MGVSVLVKIYKKYKYIKKSYRILTNSQNEDKKISKISYYKISTLLAIIITLPGIASLFILRHYNVDILYQVIVSSLIFFLCIGLSFKISKYLVKLA